MNRRSLLLSAGAGIAGLGCIRLAQAMGSTDYRVPSLGMNLTHVSYYTPCPFLDRIKASSGEWSFQGDPNPPPLNSTGYPTAMGVAKIVQTMVPVEPPAAGKSALYELTYDGEATFQLQFAEIVSTRRGKVVFRLTGPTPQAVALIYRSIGSAPPTKLSLVRQDHAALFAAGEIFAPEYLQQVSGFETLRFMDWLATNASPRTDAFAPTTALTYQDAVPLEIVIALANKVGANPWVNIPHRATDAFVLDILAKLKAGLKPGLVPTIEYSNEVWNLGFPQSQYAAEQAAALWGAGALGQTFYGYRSGQIAKLARGSGARVALGCQTVQPRLAEGVWKGVALSGASDRDFTDWIIAAYVNGTLTNRAGPTLAMMAANDIDGAIDNILNSTAPGALSVKTMTPIYAAQGEVAKAHGLRLTAYEGNLHLNAVPTFGLPPERDSVVAFYKAISEHPASVTIMRANLDAFCAAGGKLACLYDLASPSTPAGTFGLSDKPSWGFLREHLRQPA